MPNPNPTIVSASLSDKELQASINKMVANFDKGLQDMLDHTNTKVKEINEALKGIGNVNFGAKGSNDGAVVKQTKAQKEATNETERRLKKEKEVNLTLDQQAEIMGRIPREMRMPDMAKSARESFQAFYKGFNEQARQLEPLIQSWERLLQSRHTGNIEQVAQQIRNVKSEIAAIVREQTNLSRTKPQGYIDEIANRNTKIKALRDQLVSLEAEQQKLKATDPFKDNPYLDRLRAKHEELANAMRLSTDATYRLKQATAEELEVQRRRAEESTKSFYTHTMKMPTDQYDVQLAKLENIRALLQRIRSGEANFFTQTQVTGLEKEERRLIGLIGNINSAQQQVTSSTQQTTQAAQRYTEEIRKQAQAIRESAEYKAGKDVYVTTPSGYDAVINIKDRMSIEDKLTETYQKHIGQKSELDRIEQTDNEVAKERLGTETAITNEISKRKKYSTPETQVGYDVTREKLAQIIATRNNIERNQVVNWNEQTSSIKTLSAALKQYQEAYVKMSATERNSPFGKQMIADMQVLERNIQKFRQQMARPIDFESVMNLPQKTLDDIAYKMRQLASYRSGLNVETQTKEIDQVNRKYAELQKKMNDIMQKNTDMIASNTALGRSWNYMKNRLAFYFTVGASTQFVKNLIDIRSQYELLERSIGILIDSAQNGSQIFAELNSMAIKSPFTTMELGAAAKQLVAYDVAAKDVVDTTRRLADMAAAVGIPIERLTYALGQIKAYGYLNARDARMFANAGIPLVKELADRYTELEGRLVSTADVYDRIKKKAISYEDVMATVNKMTDEGGKFFNFQEKAADTLKVRIANLTLAWNNMMNEMGSANQGFLSSGLKTLSDVFKNWRSIYNLITSIIFTFGVLKATQVVVLTKMAMHINKNITLWAALESAMRKSIGAAVVNNLKSIGSLLARFSNPLSITAAVVTALGVAIGKAVLDYKDLIAANEAFNKSISDNAKENIGSIEKFFEDYKKQLSNIGGLNDADQEKLWERTQEEIEKTTKNAEDYIRVLNNIENVSSRIRLGEDVLEQSKTIQREIQRLADSGMFSIGGGFANDSAAKNLQNYQEALNEIRQEYGSVNAAIEAHTMKSRKLMADYTTQRNEVRAELNDFVSKLDNAYMPEILGQSDDVRIQMANVRSFAESLRDAFIATEEGSKIGADGIVLLNNAIDKWIAKQGVANGLIVDENGYFDKQRAKIEENKTAWEEFFRYISKKDREYLDAAIKTNNIGSDEVKNIWDKAAEEMSKRATTSYNLIQDQIAQLRNTPDIVINVVYRNEKEKLDKDQEEFQNKYIRPKGWSTLPPDKYLEQEKANREKYGTLMRKQGEDTVEYEKRISDERKTNLELQKKNGDIIEENKNKTDAYSQSVTKQAKKEKKAADDRLKAIKEIEDASGYDFSTKSENAAARKAAKQAESELAKALKEELSTIDKVRSIYKDLTKEGMSHANAVERATKGWDETVNAINRVLQKNGLQKLDLSKFAGIENPRELVNMLQSQLNTLLKRGAKPAEIKELQTKIQTLNVDAEKYDLTKITKGLNNELGKLKDEYELAVELDANPELGGVFADMIGIDKKTLSQLPKDFNGVVERLQQIVDDKLGNGKFSVLGNLNKSALDSWLQQNQVKIDSGKGKALVAITEYANKIRKDETEKQVKEWDNLLEKYAEYEYKRKQIMETAERERETARKKGASGDVFDAINRKEREEIAKLDFEEFQKSPEWIAETGDIANMSHKAIGVLINDLEQYRRTAKNLDPKQIKQINKALSNLYNEQRKNNPFKAISNMLQQSRENFLNYQAEIDAVEKEMNELYAQQTRANWTAEQETKLQSLAERWKKLKELQKQTQDIDASQWVSAIQETIGAVQQAIGVFNDLAKAIQGVNGNSDIDEAFSVLEKAGSAAAIGAQFGGWGALVGAIVGAGTSIITALSKVSDNKINAQIAKSERAVSRLELAYTDLEHAVNKAYGADVVGAKRALAAEKELELAELERQLTLERSRKSKNRDEDKIIELQKRIKELRYEIKDSINEITDDLLGSDVGSFAENLVSAMIESFKKGEDYMEVFGDKFDELIDNMIMKSIVSRVVATALDKLWDDITNNITERSKSETDAYAKAMQERQRLESMDLTAFAKEYWGTYTGGLTMQELYDAKLEAAKKAEEDAKAAYDAAMAIGDQDIKDFIEDAEQVKSAIAEPLLDAIKTYYTFGQDAESNLSALQQGIQGITEDTAGALEAYMNGVSQQVYLHSDLLTQIRDAVVGFDIDIQTASLSQILLQLQSSYQVQMSIQGILEGWNNPSGQAVRVEVVS